MKFLDRWLPQETDNVAASTIQLLARLQVPVTKTTVRQTLAAHPFYTSLLSIRESLAKWNVPAQAIQVEPAKLDKIPLPFIAHTYIRGGWFVTVTQVTDQTVTYTDSQYGKQTVMSRAHFLNAWSKKILIAQADAKSGELDYTAKRRREWLQAMRFPFLLLCAILLSVGYGLTLVKETKIIYPLWLVLLKLLGCIVSSLLLWFEEDQSNPFVQQLCKAGKNTNCTAVLKSKQSTLFGWLSWSEIGFFYFTGGLLYTFFSIASPINGIAMLAWLTLLAFPYTFFSVYYQWRIIKQWCPLCLVVQGLLLLEAGYFGINYWYGQMDMALSALSWPSGFLLVASFSLPMLLWMVGKPFIQKARQADILQIQLGKFKQNPTLFSALLEKQPTLAINPDALGITLGNPMASHTLVKVCNPYCGPCSRVHPAVEELLELSDDVKVRIIFTARNDEEDDKIVPVRHLLAIAEKQDEALTRKALDDWYHSPDKNYEVFAAKYPMNGELQKQGHKIEAMHTWCEAMQIEATPTFYFDGYKLPTPYTVHDLKHFLG